MKGKQKTSWVSMMKRLALGATASMAVMLILCGIGAAMISGGSLEESISGYISTVALLLASMVGAWVSSARQKVPRLMVCAIYGAVWFVVLFCLGTLFFDAAAQGVGTTALMCIGSSCAAGLLILRKKGRHSSGRRRYKMHRFVQSAQ